MILIKWDRTLSVNIPQIDLQHEELISLVNKLYVVFEAAENHALFSKLLRKILNKLEEHFELEKILLYNQGYKRLKAQTWINKKLADNFNALLLAVENGSKAIDRELMDYVSGRVLEHIRLDVTKYSFELKESC
ncbi:MAG: hemerythrin domain-containing protein [Candidatus Zixiibacteriota bacterium]